MGAHVKNTLGDLESLAAEIRMLRKFGEQCPEPEGAKLVLSLAGHFQSLFDELAARDGILTGEMPWWTERRPGAGHSPPSEFKSSERPSHE